jgi:simple sugar transport system ATP-binding protein
MEPALELRGLAKRFGGVHALDGVDLAIAPGEIVGLVGDNGAGKTTLLRIVAGNMTAGAGEIRVAGRAVRPASPAHARALGIEIVYQDLALCDNLSAAANLFLGRERVRRVAGLPLLDHAGMEARASELFAELGADVPPGARVRELSGGQRQAVAIARTRLANARVLLLDEPTAAIGLRQVEQVLALVRRAAEGGVAIVLVSHRMPDVFAVCGRIAVLRRGRKVADRPIGAVTPELVTGLVTGAIEAA